MSAELEKQSTEIKMHGGARPGAGRPAGSLNRTTAEIRALAGAWGPAAVEKAARLAGLVIGEDGNPEGAAGSEQVQLAALGLLLDRGFGKSVATTAIAGSDGGPAEIRLRWDEDNGTSTARRVAFLLGRAVNQQDKTEGPK
jgi:hypothetical protein